MLRTHSLARLYHFERGEIDNANKWNSGHFYNSIHIDQWHINLGIVLAKCRCTLWILTQNYARQLVKDVTSGVTEQMYSSLFLWSLKYFGFKSIINYMWELFFQCLNVISLCLNMYVSSVCCCGGKNHFFTWNCTQCLRLCYSGICGLRTEPEITKNSVTGRFYLSRTLDLRPENVLCVVDARYICYSCEQ